MADPFGDSLFSVFDDEQQATSSKKAPASLTPDIGYVSGCLLCNFVLAVRWEDGEIVARIWHRHVLPVPTAKHVLLCAVWVLVCKVQTIMVAFLTYALFCCI